MDTVMTKLDKNTFGGTPAAMYLADRLNDINSTKLTRKVSNFICSVRRPLSEVVAAHNAGFLSTRTISRYVEDMRIHVQNAADDLRRMNGELDEVCINLMANVLAGDLKNVARRSQIARNVNKGLMTLSKSDIIEHPDLQVKVKDVQDSVTDQSLIYKAQKRQDRRKDRNGS
jgi:hypothetical protein